MTDHNFQTMWPRRVTILWHLCQSTLSKPHLIQWVWIYFCCSSNSLLLSTDVLKYEPCVYPPALFEATGTMLQFDKPSQANAIQDWVSSSSTQIPQDVTSVTCVMEMLWSTKFYEKLGRLMSHCVESILSTSKKKYGQPTFCLMATRMVFPQKTIFIWDGRNHQAVTLLIRKRQHRYTA